MMPLRIASGGQGVEVVYLTDLVVESITDDTVRQDLLRQFLAESGVEDQRTRDRLEEYLGEMPDREMVAAMMAGVRKSQLRDRGGSLGDYLSAAEDEYPFAVDPLPNLYFTGIPSRPSERACPSTKCTPPPGTGRLCSASSSLPIIRFTATRPSGMTGARPRPWRAAISWCSLPRCWRWASPREPGRTPSTPWPRRSSPRARPSARYWPSTSPKTRSFMHLDTVFTMVDYDKFTVHPNILSSIMVFVMELDENGKHADPPGGRPGWRTS